MKFKPSFSRGYLVSQDRIDLINTGRDRVQGTESVVLIKFKKLPHERPVYPDTTQLVPKDPLKNVKFVIELIKEINELRKQNYLLKKELSQQERFDITDQIRNLQQTRTESLQRHEEILSAVPNFVVDVDNAGLHFENGDRNSKAFERATALQKSNQALQTRVDLLSNKARIFSGDAQVSKNVFPVSKASKEYFEPFQSQTGYSTRADDLMGDSYRDTMVCREATTNGLVFENASTNEAFNQANSNDNAVGGIIDRQLAKYTSTDRKLSKEALSGRYLDSNVSTDKISPKVNDSNGPLTNMSPTENVSSKNSCIDRLFDRNILTDILSKWDSSTNGVSTDRILFKDRSTTTDASKAISPGSALMRGTSSDRFMQRGTSADGVMHNGTVDDSVMMGTSNDGFKMQITSTDGFMNMSAPADGAMKSGTSADAVMARGTSADKIMNSGTSADAVSLIGTSCDGNTLRPTSADRVMMRGSSPDGVINKGTCANHYLLNGCSTDGVIVIGTSADKVVKRGTSTDGVMLRGTSADGVTKRGTSTDAVMMKGTATDRVMPRGTSAGRFMKRVSSNDGIPFSGTSRNQDIMRGSSTSGVMMKNTSDDRTSPKPDSVTSSNTLTNTVSVRNTYMDRLLSKDIIHDVLFPQKQENSNISTQRSLVGETTSTNVLPPRDSLTRQALMSDRSRDPSTDRALERNACAGTNITSTDKLPARNSYLDRFLSRSNFIEVLPTRNSDLRDASNENILSKNPPDHTDVRPKENTLSKTSLLRNTSVDTQPTNSEIADAPKDSYTPNHPLPFSDRHMYESLPCYDDQPDVVKNDSVTGIKCPADDQTKNSDTPTVDQVACMKVQPTSDPIYPYGYRATKWHYSLSDSEVATFL